MRLASDFEGKGRQMKNFMQLTMTFEVETDGPLPIDEWHNVARSALPMVANLARTANGVLQVTPKSAAIAVQDDAVVAAADFAPKRGRKAKIAP